ncbi:MAG: hypothetical protein ACI4XQ_00490 [Eubacteriales bacterium]
MKRAAAVLLMLICATLLFAGCEDGRREETTKATTAATTVVSTNATTAATTPKVTTEATTDRATEVIPGTSGNGTDFGETSNQSAMTSENAPGEVTGGESGTSGPESGSEGAVGSGS